MIRNNIRKFQDFYLHFFKMRDIPKATKLSEIGRKVYNSGICNLPSTNLEKKDEFILLQNKCLEYIKNFNIHEFEKFDVDKFSSIKEIISYSEKKSNAVCIDRNSDFFYSKDSHSYRPIDSNMYDFFQPQYLDSSFRNLIHFFKKFYLNHLIDSLNKSYRKQFIFSHCSLYCYRDNHSPRWIHFDSYKSHIKLFIALNTINTLSFGPYCYVIGSHKNKAFKIFNYFFNKLVLSDVGSKPTDGSFLSKRYASPAFLNQHDLLISDNSGYHGDLPCLDNKLEKNLLVINLYENNA